LAEAALRDDYDRATELVKQIGKDGEVALSHYRDWPLFRVLRSQPQFEDAVLEVFGEPLNKVELPIAQSKKEPEEGQIPMISEPLES
jgi:hypothetical protein